MSARSLQLPLALAVALLMCACDGTTVREYSADAIEGRIVDAETGAPVVGANVVAGWEALGGLEGGNTVGWVQVMEAVTDPAGRFSFPAWGPVKWGKRGAVTTRSPLLIVFKRGYARLLLTQRSRSVIEIAPAHMQSDWNGRTIELGWFKGSYPLYADNIGWLDIQLNALLNNEECNWKAIPRFLAALQREDALFVDAGLDAKFGSLDYLNARYGKDCGDLKRYVREHGQ